MRAERSHVIQQITGKHHPLVKRLRAMARSAELLNGGDVLLETPNLIEDALRSGVEISTVLLRADATPAARSLTRQIPASAARFEVDSKIFPDLTTTQNSPGILALAKQPEWAESDLFRSSPSLLLVVAGVQDPGNLGTLLRAAEAFGATGVLATKGTVSPFNAKAVRAAAGTLFRLPIVANLTTQQVISMLRHEKVTLLASAAGGGSLVAELDLTAPLALALGSEGAGLPRELSEAGTTVRIPMAPQVESLSVASAAAILLYEVARQRDAALTNKRN
jgi:RNA methyltransferase, TrmH family